MTNTDWQMPEEDADRLLDASYSLGQAIAQTDSLHERDTDTLVMLAFRMAGLRRHADWDAVDQVLDAIDDGIGDWFLTHETTREEG